MPGELDLKPQSNISFSSNLGQRAVYVTAPPLAIFSTHFGLLASSSNVHNVIFAIFQVT